MRLLNTRTLELQQFNAETVPEYAILSHTWEDEEVTLQELHTLAARRKRGYKKISDFCDEALAGGLEWAWVDTCCIDKTDLVELSQAINSMFAWYRDASICLAYLNDFHLRQQGYDWNDSELGTCRWFTRGWTLQELIAPERMVFYDARWQPVGTKIGLATLLSSITGIGTELLRAQKSLRDFSSAQKMSWAAYRQTTRVEDRAYSLLGLFNICFSPVYGEGWRAFGRLQEEILKDSTDQSIFAWLGNGCTDTSGAGLRRCSILAPTPDCFHHASDIIRAPYSVYYDDAHPRLAPHISGAKGKDLQRLNQPITMSNTGLRLALWVKRLCMTRHGYLVEAMLNCCYSFDPSRKMTIVLVTGIDSFASEETLDIRPAWRVEPDYVGSVHGMSGHAVIFDLYPIHKVLPRSIENMRSRHELREAHSFRRREAMRRIDKTVSAADKFSIRDIKNFVTNAVVIGGMVVIPMVSMATRKKGERLD